jgi:hypothetical protein
MATYKFIYAVRVRATPNVNSTQIGRVGETSQIEIRSTQRVGDYLFGEVVTKIDSDDEIRGWVALGYKGEAYALPVGRPPIPPPSTRPPLLLGVHFHDSRGHKFAQGFLSQGGMGATIMEGYTFASQLKIAYPKAAIKVRRWWSGNFIPPVDLNLLWGAEDPNLIYLSPINESDCVNQDADGVRQRAEFDREMARLVKERTGGKFNASSGRWEGGAIYVASPYSMGTPDFTKEEVKRSVRDHLAPHYNSNLLAYGYHSYSPTPDHIDRPDEWIWYERRPDFLFRDCGFNPDPSLAGVYMDETGVDTMGRGGYKSWNMDGNGVKSHLNKLQDALRRPLVIGSSSYPSPYRAADVFAATEDQRWGGYQVQDFLPNIAEVSKIAMS